jgi:hypothetical protein
MRNAFVTSSEHQHPQAMVAHHVRRQGQACAYLGSPLYAGLLERIASDVETGGASWRALEPFVGWGEGAAYILRVMGAIHRLVLADEAPELAPHFAPGGDAGAAWPLVTQLLEERGDEIRDMALAQAVQTNEVGRCAALAPAILWSSKGMPIRLLELGASAGLNLRWNAYRYEDAWGDPASPVALNDLYEQPRPPFDPPRPEIVERRGCDANPVDPTTEGGRLTLLSFVWPDQAQRIALLRAALDLAPTIPANVDKANAADWIERALGETPPTKQAITVVYHSIFWQYLDAADQERIRTALDEAGAKATHEAPLAWVRMEPQDELARVEATVWPGGETHLLARAGYHGRPVRWVA